MGFYKKILYQFYSNEDVPIIFLLMELFIELWLTLTKYAIWCSFWYLYDQ